jgi:hypothetical protein
MRTEPDETITTFFPFGAATTQRLKGMFNLNDPRWGRSDDKPADNGNSGRSS